MLNPINLFQPIHIPKIHWASPQVLQLRPVELPALKPNQVRVKASHVGLAVGNFGTCFGHMFCRQTVESLWRFDDQNGFMLGEPVGISRTNIYNIINIIIYRCICIYIYIIYKHLGIYALIDTFLFFAQMEAAGVNPSDTYLRLGMEGPYAAVPHLLPWLGLIFLIVGETYIYIYILFRYIHIIIIVISIVIVIIIILIIIIYILLRYI